MNGYKKSFFWILDKRSIILVMILVLFIMLTSYEFIETAYFKLFALEFAFTFACLAFGRQAFTLLNH
ncbi:MAG: hypothetical protein LBP59_03490 [Planctomycetaceae bacterium]|nr:hypothetical protein [Planctomycetaceae bacterium]